MRKIFIDGSAGTTGLRLEERLRRRGDITLLTLPEKLRKDLQARAEKLNEADAAMLCLPDDAAREAVALVQNPDTVVIDASTAHRTAPGWAYGFPELDASFRENILQGKRIAVPGCHASGFIALVKPLTEAGILTGGALLHCVSITGYTGGGKAMIAEYEAESRTNGDPLHIPRQYAFGQAHKHLPEMAAYAGLEAPPVFCPVVGDFPRGIELTIPLHASQISATSQEILDCYRAVYQGAALIKVFPEISGMPPLSCHDALHISVAGNEERMLLIARLDNLGKGASGAAVQCLNLAIGAEETEGLEI
ncbi:MAG: N-acetyl-gamma-glutamyl-phosphate reductase [Desulfovibrionaceae bacterium]|nr:N-acetyl-gamma-glutamyl-phosphate reductase [Desulfovibrionaceae bacterium]